MEGGFSFAYRWEDVTFYYRLALGGHEIFGVHLGGRIDGAFFSRR